MKNTSALDQPLSKRDFLEIMTEFKKDQDRQFSSVQGELKKHSQLLQKHAVQLEKNTQSIKSLKNHIDTVVDRVVADQQDAQIEFSTSVEMIPAIREEVIQHEDRIGKLERVVLQR